jgi:hypothetical protein
MSDELPVVTSLEGRTFSYKGRQYSVETATATRRHFDELTRSTGAPVEIRFTVTSPEQPAPIGVYLRLSPEHAADLDFVQSALEETVAQIVDGELAPGAGEYL